MKNKILSGGIAFTLLAGVLVLGARAQKETKEERALTEKTGIIEVMKADPAKKEKYNTVLLKVGEETIKLLPGKENKKEFKNLETLAGKNVAVKGTLLPANPPKYPLAALKVASFAEIKAAKPAAPAKAEAPAKPAAAPDKK